jgi:hypothetical protein
MSEQPEMNVDPLAQKLARFTPDATGLDRDALIFAAGRASVRPRRHWPMLTGLLALTQSLTLVLYFMRPNETGLSTVVVVQPLTESQAADDISPRPTPATTDPRQLAYYMALMTGDIDDLPQATLDVNPVAPEPILTVRSFASVVIVN